VGPITKLRSVILHYSLPLQYLISKVTMPERRAVAKWVRQIEKVALPGDILLTHENWHLSNVSIPGFYSHAAFLVAQDRVVEALPQGVVETDLIDFIMKKDFVAVVRPVGVTPEECRAGVRDALTLVGRPYDFMFAYSPDEKSNRAFYCSEIPYFCFRSSKWAKSFTPRVVLGELTIAPQDYYDATNGPKLDLVCQF
jgi:hypothetical protein